MNFGGEGGDDSQFMTGVIGLRDYPGRLVRELMALLRTRDVVGITEINPHWFRYAMGTPHFCGNGLYRGCHDGFDVAIFWNAQSVTPTNPSEMGILHPNFLRSEILAAETRHLQWRNFWCVKFKFVASPHVIFTAACTCSLAAGVKTQDDITVIKGNSSATKLEFKTKITLRALEKRLRYCHRSSFAADPVHTLVFLGDWNIRASNFIEAAKDAKALAVDFTSASTR